MKGDRVEAVVDTGQGTRTFEITASRAGRRLEVTSGRGIVEVTEVTRHGTPVRTARFMATRLIALVEHPALGSVGTGVEVSVRRRMGRGVPAASGGSGAARRPGQQRASRQDAVAPDETADETDPADSRSGLERAEAAAGGPDPVDELEALGT